MSLGVKDVERLIREGWSFSKVSRYWKQGAPLGPHVWEISRISDGCLTWYLIRVNSAADRLIMEHKAKQAADKDAE